MWHARPACDHPQITQITQIRSVSHDKAQKAQNEIKTRSAIFVQSDPQLERFPF
jgi:hypothetical protein